MSGPSTRTALVTGVAGFIGSHLAERLLDAGYRVVGVDAFDDYYDPAMKRRNVTALVAHPRFSLEPVDLAEAAAAKDLAARVRPDVLVHLAGLAGVRLSVSAPERYVRQNVVATQNVLDAWRAAGTPIVLASSSSVYGNTTPAPFREDAPCDAPASPYAATKRACELLASVQHALHGTRITALRFFTVYGPRQRPDLAIRKFATAMLRRQPITIFGDGSMARDFTHVSDIVRGIQRAIEQPAPGFSIVNLGGSAPVRVDDLVARLSRALRRTPQIEHVARPSGEMDATWADVRRAEALWGWRAEVAIDDGLADFARWLSAEEGIPLDRPAAAFDAAVAG